MDYCSAILSQNILVGAFPPHNKQKIISRRVVLKESFQSTMDDIQADFPPMTISGILTQKENNHILPIVLKQCLKCFESKLLNIIV